ncbi:MAG: carboxylesterase [Tatlockia sp.]|nr:carboxylesterase [Tatlockia sp.]
MNVYKKEPQQQAEACVIWMHGLGADASDMMGLVEQLSIDDLALRHIFLNAPVRPVTLNGGMAMRAWYDIVGMQLTDREDKEGIEHSAAFIRGIYEDQLNNGLTKNKIFFAGFSQGGAMALYTALHMTQPVAGVIALSAYLPMADKCKTDLAKNTPIFMASGQYDPIVLPIWSKETASKLTNSGYSEISLHSYLMEHSICGEEINDLSHWLRVQLEGELQ